MKKIAEKDGTKLVTFLLDFSDFVRSFVRPAIKEKSLKTLINSEYQTFHLVAGAGLEPATFGL